MRLPLRRAIPVDSALEEPQRVALLRAFVSLTIAAHEAAREGRQFVARQRAAHARELYQAFTVGYSREREGRAA